MADVADAVAQDQIADSLVAPLETQDDAAHTGADADSQVQDDATADQQLADDSQDIADDQLPSEQEKDYPLSVLQKYAGRYGFTADEVAQDNRAALTVKRFLDQEIYINQLKSQADLSQQTQDDDTPQVQQAEPTRPATTQEHIALVEKTVKNYTSPEISAYVGDKFMKIFGAKPMTSDQSNALNELMTFGVINVLNSVLPDMLSHQIAPGKSFFQHMVESTYEGFGEFHENSMLDRAWNKAISSDPKFANLPALNVKGSGDLRAQAAEQIAGSVEEFDAMTFKGKDGKPLSAYQNAVKKYTMLAKVMSGQKLTPAEANKFVEAGRKAAQKDSIQRQAGNLGSGQSKGQIASSGGDDDFWKSAKEIYQNQHGSL